MSRAQSSLVPEIDFARPQPVFDRGVPWLGWAMLAVVLVLAAMLAADYADQLARRDQAGNQWRAAGFKSAGDTAVTGAVAAEIGFVDNSLALGRIPWETVFREVEGAKGPQMRPEVILLGLNLRGARHEVHITGEAVDFAALSAYMARLGARAGLADMRLLGHQPLTKGTPAAIRFELILHWRAE